MNISVLCTDPTHPVNSWLRRWKAEMDAAGHAAALFSDKKDLTGGDILFLVSCTQIIRDAEREKFRAVIVLHASDLPRGRGWSPHIWAVVNGASQITVCALAAADPVDTGAVWQRVTFDLEGHELLPEINEKLFAAELELMTRVVQQFESITPVPQQGDAGPYMARRTPEDSRLSPTRSLAEQFDLLRVVDNERYPAFMDHRGQRYLIRIEKIKNAH